MREHEHKWTYGEGRNSTSAKCMKCGEEAFVTSIIHDLQTHLRLEREAASAYAHDRSKQYTDKSSAKCALEDLAVAIRRGDHIEAANHGELDGLIAHGRRFEKAWKLARWNARGEGEDAVSVVGSKIWIIACDQCAYIEAGRTRRALAYCQHTCVADGRPSGKTRVERVRVSKIRPLST